MSKDFAVYDKLMKPLINVENIYLSKIDKQKFTIPILKFLDDFHFRNNINYRNMIASDRGLNRGSHSYGIPVRMFKHKDFMSVPADEIIKTLLSSGTTGQLQSKIYLNANTARSQTLVLSRIMSKLIGSKRIPMLIVDSESITKDRTVFSARTTGIRGFSIFGKDIHYALDDNLEFNVDTVTKFFNKYHDEPKLIFGFTFLIWKNFADNLKCLNQNLSFEKSILLHGGGWKKLESQKVSKLDFKENFINLGFDKVHDYYGMVEQTGSIFIECEKGYFHTNNFNDLTIRDPMTYLQQKNGSEGLISLESILPFSYPGHRILTEDLGVIIGEDNCTCGRKGKYFKVNGRLPKSEIRGCSNAIEL
jgi:hypothetical protein